MAYIEPTEISDKHVARLVSKSPDLVAKCLKQSDRKVRALARSRGVSSDKIPVDGNDLTTSETLYIFGEFWFCSYICMAVAKSVNVDDVYTSKAEDYEKMAERAKKDVTIETILENEVTGQANRTGPIPIY